MEDRILFEDNHLIVINKKAGELVQGDKTGDTPLLESVKAFLKKKYKALVRLNNQFKLRTPKKTYWAIVSKNFKYKKGSLTHWMTRNTKQNKSKAHNNKVPNGKLAKLYFKKLKSFDNYCQLEVNLKTGRHHQIRAQLSAINFPIQGDLKYGSSRKNRDGSISLHGRSLEIYHPITKKILVFSADPQRVGIWKAVLFD